LVLDDAAPIPGRRGNLCLADPATTRACHAGIAAMRHAAGQCS